MTTQRASNSLDTVDLVKVKGAKCQPLTSTFFLLLFMVTPSYSYFAKF